MSYIFRAGIISLGRWFVRHAGGGTNTTGAGPLDAVAGLACLMLSGNFRGPGRGRHPMGLNLTSG